MTLVRRWLRLAVSTVGVLVLLGITLAGGVVGGFFGSLRLLEEYAPPPAPHTLPAPAAPPPVDLSREKLDALLEGDPAPATAQPGAAPAEPQAGAPEAPAAPAKLAPGAALARAIASVRLHRPLDPASLRPLECSQISLTRDWLWAARGYVFTSDEAKALFARQTGYQPDANVTLAEVETSLEAVDQANRNVLTAALKANACPCADADPTRPCPE